MEGVREALVMAKHILSSQAVDQANKLAKKQSEVLRLSNELASSRLDFSSGEKFNSYENNSVNTSVFSPLKCRETTDSSP